MRRYASFAVLLLLAAASAWFYPKEPATTARPPPDCATMGNCGKPPPERSSLPQGDGFDFYVLSLSWSPSFCEGDRSSGNDRQCAANSSLGFIVHGLWPQNERGYPQFCASNEPERVPEQLGRTLFDIMPGMGLIGHEWRKHGRCTGLSQKDYFSLVRAAWNRVRIPAEIGDGRSRRDMTVSGIEKAITAANPGLPAKGIAVGCNRNLLEDIRICMTKSLQFRACAEVDRQACSLDTVTLPARAGQK